MKNVLPYLFLFVCTPAYSQVIFQDNFNSSADWTVAQGATSTCCRSCTSDGTCASYPPNWDGYYNGGSYCSDPGHNNFYISSTNPRGSGKSLTFWDESCTQDFGNSDAQVGKSLGAVYSEVWIQYYIKFQYPFHWEVMANGDGGGHKWFHLQYHEGTSTPWNYFGNPANMPIGVPGIHTYYDHVYYYSAYRCEINYYCQGTPSYQFDVGTDMDHVDLGTWSSVFGDNNWHKVEFYYKMNTNAGATFHADGIHRFWLDGVLKYESSNIPFSDNGSQQSPRRGFNFFAIGGNNSNYWNQSCNGTACEQWYAIDDLVLSQTRYTGGGTAPANPTNLRINH